MFYIQSSGQMWQGYKARSGCLGREGREWKGKGCSGADGWIFYSIQFTRIPRPFHCIGILSCLSCWLHTVAVCEHYSGGDNTNYTQEEAKTVSVVTTLTSCWEDMPVSVSRAAAIPASWPLRRQHILTPAQPWRPLHPVHTISHPPCVLSTHYHCHWPHTSFMTETFRNRTLY